MNLHWKLTRVFAPVVFLFSWCLMAATSPGDSPVVMPAATAGSSATNSARPRIVFATNSFDFGTVKQGESVKHEFIFTNTGTAVLEILDVKPGCGCTTAGTWDKRVEPGKTGSIPLQFNPAGFGGRVAKSATVTCNDSNTPTVFLQLTGNVWKPIDITPTMAMFNFTADEQTNQTKTLHIVNNLDYPIQLTNITCTSSSFKAELTTVKEGKEFDLQVTAMPPFNSPTVFGNVIIKTSGSNAPSINATVYAVTQPLVQAFPQQVTLPPGPLTNAYNSQLILRNNSTNLIQLSDPSIEIPGAEVRIQELQPGRQFALHSTFPSGLQVPPGQRPEIIVKSDHPKQTLIRIPVVQPAKPATVSKPAASPPATKISSTTRVVPTRVAVPAATK